MPASPSLSQDILSVWRDLRSRGPSPYELMGRRAWRPLADIAFDWIAILLCVAAVHEGALWSLPLCLLAIGNRQRALGNVLHDGAHHNLCSGPRLNDAIVRAFVAPLLMNELERYRRLHFQHHARLGEPQGDPDLIHPLGSPEGTWIVTYAALLLDGRTWRQSIWGHLGARIAPLSVAYIVLWWAAALALLARLLGGSFAAEFVLLWFAARATSFHAITALREMCDHFGMQPGGVYSFTRDITARCALRWLIHPRNNGYHLTHHLMPSVPYYRLPQAHAALSRTPTFARRACVCDSYLTGERAVIGSAPALAGGHGAIGVPVPASVLVPASAAQRAAP